MHNLLESCSDALGAIGSCTKQQLAQAWLLPVHVASLACPSYVHVHPSALQ